MDNRDRFLTPVASYQGHWHPLEANCANSDISILTVCFHA